MLEILLVDDEPAIRLPVGDALRAVGHRVTACADGEAALDAIQRQSFDLVISDIRLPKADGLTIFRRTRALSPTTEVILITAYGAVEDAVGALKDGAFDYLTKPFDVDELLLRVQRIADKRDLQAELSNARAELATRAPSSDIIGKAPSMRRLLERVEMIAPSEAPVLIQGESGTGKELVARRLHALSDRSDMPFVAVNCAAFPETLIEAELFGHERGAFTGAVRRRDGRFKAAHRGTLFLDEVAELPLMAQAKLLRVLQEGVVEPLGTDTPVRVDVRVISATHRDLRTRIQQGHFREDLFYRLNVLDISIPALRARKGDMPLLVEHFLKRYNKSDTVPDISPRAWAALNEYGFPGNVRELEHAIHHAVVLSQGREIDLPHLPDIIVGSEIHEVREDVDLRPLSVAMKEFERHYLLRALRLTAGQRTKAAELLGISRKNLWEKLKAQGISDDDIGQTAE
ncbi:MAG: sigma-54-dependent transcriptional regulator [Bradymonadia bacterium]